MSIVNFCVFPDRALVGVDTLAGPVGGPHVEVCKLFPLAHANAVLAARGHAGLLTLVASALCLVPGDFDAVADRMPQVLEHAFSWFQANARRINTSADVLAALEAQEIALVGWSPRRGSMIGLHYVQVAAADGFHTREVDGAALSPGADCFVDGWPQYDPDSMEEMGATAKQQAAYLRQTFPGIAVGGRFLVAELTQSRLQVACAVASL